MTNAKKPCTDEVRGFFFGRDMGRAAVQNEAWRNASQAQAKQEPS
jgi:hypothetical protein